MVIIINTFSSSLIEACLDFKRRTEFESGVAVFHLPIAHLNPFA